MNIAVNDLSFINQFKCEKEAIDSMYKFCDLLRFLQDDKVSGVKVPVEIRNSPEIHLDMIIASDACTLKDVLFKIKQQDKEKYLFLITVLSKYTSNESKYNEQDIFVYNGMASKHCARYRDEFLISLTSGGEFSQVFLKGTINGKTPIEIRNISDELHIYHYWEPLGFREYELNPKHGARSYVRNNGMSVGIAPKTDQLGQELLNKSIAYRSKIYSVDINDNNAIYEFPRTRDNIFHAFKREDLQPDLKKKIIRIWHEKNDTNGMSC